VYTLGIMANSGVDAKIKEIEARYKEKVRAIKKKRDEELSKVRRSIDDRRIDIITKEIRQNI